MRWGRLGGTRLRLWLLALPLALGAALAGVVLASRDASGTTYEIHPGDDLFGTLETLEAGDEVFIHSGTYTIPPRLYEVTWPGTDGARIVVRGAPGERRPTIVGRRDQNIIGLDGSHFTLSHIEFRGGSHGLRLGDVDHATLENLVVHDLGDVGISCNRPGKVCDDVTLRRNEIYDTGQEAMGEGLYLGCQDESCVFENGVVEGNFVHDTGGSQGDGIEIKPGSFGNTIRDNVIYRTRYPGITISGFKEGAGRRNLVERNVVWKTRSDGIRITGEAIVRNNIVLGAPWSGIASRPFPGSTAKNVVIANNTVVGAGDSCLLGGDWENAGPQLVANNALFCKGAKAIELPQGSPGATFSTNVILGSSDAGGGTIRAGRVAGDLGDPSKGNVYPPAGSELIDAANPRYAPANDFKGRPRGEHPDVGAYERQDRQR